MLHRVKQVKQSTIETVRKSFMAVTFIKYSTLSLLSCIPNLTSKMCLIKLSSWSYSNWSVACPLCCKNYILYLYNRQQEHWTSESDLSKLLGWKPLNNFKESLVRFEDECHQSMALYFYDRQKMSNLLTFSRKIKLKKKKKKKGFTCEEIYRQISKPTKQVVLTLWNRPSM